jgi:hypothetical protein
MNKNLAPKIIAIASFLILTSSLFLIPSAHAQITSNPQFLITWKPTASSIPSNYIGKALPSLGSKVTADFELVSNGKILNISGQTIYWYLEDTLIGGGTGVQQVTFPLFGTPPGSLTLKIELPSYNGQYLIHTIDIPYVNPAVVIYAPYPNGDFSSSPLTVTALPYFFTASASQLSYTWAVNGQTGSNAENPQTAEVTLPQGTPSGTGITISLSVENPAGAATAATQSTLTYSNQL